MNHDINMQKFVNSMSSSCQIHTSAVIGNNVTLGEGVVIHPFVVIGNNVKVGNHTEIFPGSVIGKAPKGAGVLARKIEYLDHVKIGANCTIGPHAIIYADVEIGESTLIGDGVSIREKCRVSHHVLISRYVTLNYNVVIGEYSKVMDNSHLTGNMRVGKHVFISAGVMSANDNNMGTQYTDEIIGPQIADHAKVGLGAILLPNIKIGVKALVAAGAVVTKDVPANVMVKGIPARS